MDRRTNESPMEFEWQTRAPGDVTSPFYQLAMEHERENNNKKRPYNIFDSPSKPSTPSLGQSTSQPFLFSQPPSKTQQSSFSSFSQFTTPRKNELDFSSGQENASSPDNADNDETPEQPSRSDRRGSLFNFYGRLGSGHSPGRGEIPRSNRFSNVVINRVKKRRRRDREIDRHFRRTSEDTEWPIARDADRDPQHQHQHQHRHGHDDQAQSQRHRHRQQQQQRQRRQSYIPQPHEIPFLSRLFTFLESHPHIPRILSYYAQFAFNLVLAFLTLYVIVAFLLAIRSDITKTTDEVSADILAEMDACARNFVENRCGGEDGKRLPALEVVCDTWERCMNRDPAKVGRARVSAKTLAEIFNGFIEPISLKTMIFFIASLTSFVAVSNLTFSFFRNKSNNPPHAAPSSAADSYPFTPPGMQHHPSHLAYASGGPGFGVNGTPGGGHQPQHHYLGQSFEMSPSKGARGADNGTRQGQIGYWNDDRERTPSPVKKGMKFT